MEPIHLNSKLSRSYTFRRDRHFKYPIVKEEQTSPMTASHNFVHEDSTVPTPYSKDDLPGEIYSDRQRSECMKYIKTYDFLQRQSTSLTGSPRSPGSKPPMPLAASVSLNTLQRVYSFSNFTEKHEELGQSSLDAPGYSKSSTRPVKDKSFEISAILEENSISEVNLQEHPQIVHTSPDLSNSYRKYSKNSHDNTSENINLQQTPLESCGVSSNLKSERAEVIKTRSSLLMNLEDHCDDSIPLSFEEAFSIYKSVKLEYYVQGMWISQFRDYFCCNKQVVLDDDYNEICEKLIMFSYCGFEASDSFHCRLLVSIKEILSSKSAYKENWSDFGFSSNAPADTDLKHEIATLGLFQILFLSKYLNSMLNEILMHCLENHMAFVLISFDISEICITILRKKGLHAMIQQTGKVMEIMFFLYAGCLIYWFNLHKSQQKLPAEINLIVEKMAMKHPDVFIHLARQKWNDEET